MTGNKKIALFYDGLSVHKTKEAMEYIDNNLGWSRIRCLLVDGQPHRMLLCLNEINIQKKDFDEIM